MQIKRFLFKLRMFRSRGPQRGRLVRNYFFIFVGGMIASGLTEFYFRYYKTQEQVGLIQREIADAAPNP
jgi:hypothetical protein